MNEDLISAWLDGDATPEQVAELESRLLGDAAFSRTFVEMSRQDWILRFISRDEAAGDQAAAPMPISGCRRDDRIRRPSSPMRPRALPRRRGGLARWGIAISLVAAIAILLRTTWLSPEVRVIAGAGMAADGRTLSIGDAVRVGDGIRAGEQGLVLRWRDGTRIELAAGTGLTIALAKSLLLDGGSLRAEVAKQHGGETVAIETALARSTIVGTRFTLEADSGRTRLAVEEGAVRFADLVLGVERLVRSGEAAEVRTARPSQPAMPIGVPSPGLALWLRADDAVAAGPGPVARWRDRSGHGRDAVQEVAARRPTAMRGALGDVVSFDAAARDELDFPLAVNGWRGMTIALVSACAVNSSDSSSKNAAVFWDETATWGNVYVSPFRSTVNWRFGTTQVGNLPSWTRPVPDPGLTLIVTRKAGTQDELYVGGHLVLRESARLPVIAACTDTGMLGRGIQSTFWSGAIAELVVYDRALDDGERIELERRLGERWRLGR